MSNLLLQCIGQYSSNNTRRIPLADKAFRSLSTKEQDRVYGDLYGTEEPIQESCEFIKKKLADLHRELGLLSEETKKHYLLAVDIEEKQQSLCNNNSNNEYYVTNPNFRLMFLRADRFDARLAARRFARFFKEKFELFGEESLARRIRQEDLKHHEDMKALISGGISFTGATDWAGRSIVFFRRKQAVKENLVSFRRVVFFTLQNALEENEISQIKGILCIGYNMGGAQFSRPSDVRVMFPIATMMFHALPVRVAGIHNYHNDMKEHFINNMFLVVCPKDVRARFHNHYEETFLECLLNLVSVGINPATLPLKPDGDFEHEMLFSYLRKRRGFDE